MTPYKIDPGFYWVLLYDHKHWTVGEYDGDTWEIVGYDRTFSWRDIKDIHTTRIEKPL